MQVVEARGNIVGVMSDQFCHTIRSSVYWSMSTGPKRRRRGAPIQFNSRRTTSIMLSRHCHLTAGDPMHWLSIVYTHRRLFAPANMIISPRLRPREHRPAEHAHSHRLRVRIYDIFTTRSIAQRRYLYLGNAIRRSPGHVRNLCENNDQIYSNKTWGKSNVSPPGCATSRACNRLHFLPYVNAIYRMSPILNSVDKTNTKLVDSTTSLEGSKN